MFGGRSVDRIINYGNFRQFGYCNDKICARPVKGVVLSFFALGASEMYEGETREGSRYAADGIIVINPYSNPWAWMNRQTIDLTDELIDVIFDKLNLDDNIPIVATGPSMGGYAALVYAAYGARKVAGCVVNCPVCDLLYQYGSRFTDARTMYSAFGNLPGTLEDALRNSSPLYITDKMPADAVYHLFHCGADTAVKVEKNSIAFYEKMKADHEIYLTVVPDREHTNLTDEAWEQYGKAVRSFFY